MGLTHHKPGFIHISQGFHPSKLFNILSQKIEKLTAWSRYLKALEEYLPAILIRPRISNVYIHCHTLIFARLELILMFFWVMVLLLTIIEHGFQLVDWLKWCLCGRSKPRLKDWRAENLKICRHIWMKNVLVA